MNVVTHPDVESSRQSLLSKIADGDDSAVELCLEEFGGLVWSLARRFCRDEAEAEDATQEIFLEIWKSAGRFDPQRSSESAFIAMIARRRLIDRLRRKGASPDTVPLDVEPIETKHRPTEHRAELADDAAKAAKCMSRLTGRQQSILELSIHHGISHRGIASRLEMPLGTVKSYARRALIQLRDCMRRGHLAQVEGSGS